MQYEFKDFGQTADNFSPSIQVILNESNLDNVLSTRGFTFQTLTVDGRGKTSYNVDSQDIYGMHGTALNNTTLNNRIISVRAWVSAVDIPSYNRGMEQLSRRGYARKIHNLAFTDDIDHTWYATLQSINDGDNESLTQIVELEFVCTDPYKYTEEKTIETTNGAPIEVDSFIPVIPEEIALTFPNASDARKWTITNSSNGYRLVYDQSGSASGTTIRIRQKEDYIGYVDSVNHYKDIDLRFADFDEFTVGDGDRISVSPTPSKIEITYNGVRL